ncbi:putative Late embryogenesis abundant protein, LEA-14 [Medicago truncatula]|uniref:Chaperonin CPN60-like protein n=1 Tax=Medicago truncatula TaxID=3880 RepID=I3S7U3_MEDTR|nr:NDR1/HIN1-like protein 2 [Medicago truncatula]AFK36335.1 unknown [Medicago truncatula]KEH18354.1 chaperonin CPN60-like protein [Medicago truncatula]RHN39276.1 putative Late embryogenesis abundant protein, LEA-14 [Medicago truncatula]
MTNNTTIHPQAKTTTNGGAATAVKPSFPATKAQIYGATRPTYRPQTHRHRNNRNWCCTICCWLLLILIFVLILLGVAGTVVYFLYHPQRPSFTVTSLKLTSSEFDLTLSTTNPNEKITFSYQPISVSLLAGELDVGDGVIPSFEHGTKNTTMLKALVERKSVKRKSLELKMKMETKVEAKMWVFKTPHVGINVLCDGIDVAGEKVTTADEKCAVDVRFKVWKWTLG